MAAAWPPASYSLTLDALSAQAFPHHFLYNDTILVTILRKEELPGGTCYVVVARRASRPC
jgi:hypothetical protein